jgi:hypothetical protein
MATGSLEKSLFEKDDLQREELKRELRRKIVAGSVLLSLHKRQGTMPYLLQVIEPYLRKSERKLFGLPI